MKEIADYLKKIGETLKPLESYEIKKIEETYNVMVKASGKKYITATITARFGSINKVKAAT